MRKRGSRDAAPQRSAPDSHADINIGERIQSGHTAPAFSPNESLDLGSYTSDIEGTLQLDLLGLYYKFFHAAHPCTLPRQSLTRRLFDDELQLPVEVIYYIGSLFAPDDQSGGRQDRMESALGDFRRSARIPDPFDVQAVLLYSIAVYWRNEPSAGTALLEESASMAAALGMHRKEFARQNGQRDAVLKESWRRTWWQIFIADVHIAGSAHTFHFRTGGVDMTADLPCEEHEYEAGVR